MGTYASSLLPKPQVEGMDRDSEKKLQLEERDTSLIKDLYQYIRGDNIVEARKLVKNCSRDFKQKFIRQNDTYPFEPIIICAINNSSLETLKFVVDECRVNIKDPIRLFYSLFRNELKGTIPHEGKMCFLSPLQYAICTKSCNLEKIKFLVDRDAEFNSTTIEGVTCLMLAATRHFNVCEFLIENGASVDAVSNTGKTALHFAVEAYCYDIAKLLMDRGADVNSTCSNGMTCLMLAASRDFLTCQLLLSKGANIFTENEKGETALRIAVISNQPDMAKLLVAKGADPFCFDENGDELISAAYSRRDEETLIALIDGLSLRANNCQLEQIDKHRRLITCCIFRWNLKWNNIRPYIAFKQSVSSIPPTLENLQRDLELGLELTRELFGHMHGLFYEALHETAECYFNADFFHQWLCQLAYNFKTFRSPDLNVDERCKEYDRIIRHIRCSISSRCLVRNMQGSLGFDAVDGLLATVIEEAANCSDPGEVAAFRDFIVLLIRLALLLQSDNHRRETFRYLLHRAVKLRTRTRPGFRFLRAAMTDCIIIAKLMTKPISDIVNLLLECGADVNERDEYGNNVVHFLYLSRDFDAQTSKEFALTLIKHGVHLDARNRTGVTTSACLRMYGIEIEPSISLKCLAARTIRHFQISFAGIIPYELVDFVEMH